MGLLGQFYSCNEVETKETLAKSSANEISETTDEIDLKKILNPEQYELVSKTSLTVDSMHSVIKEALSELENNQDSIAVSLKYNSDIKQFKFKINYLRLDMRKAFSDDLELYKKQIDDITDKQWMSMSEDFNKINELGFDINYKKE